jgi:hypothetical protein
MRFFGRSSHNGSENFWSPMRICSTLPIDTVPTHRRLALLDIKGGRLPRDTFHR